MTHNAQAGQNVIILFHHGLLLRRVVRASVIGRGAEWPRVPKENANLLRRFPAAGATAGTHTCALIGIRYDSDASKRLGNLSRRPEIDACEKDSKTPIAEPSGSAAPG